MKKKIDFKILWKLFYIMFVLSSCTFGGGFVIISLMNKKFVHDLKWLKEDEMMDITAITQAAPGANVINASVVVGYKMQGVLGALSAVLGSIIPPMIIISVISLFYNAFRENKIVSIALQVMRAGVAAVILDVTIDLAKNVVNTRSILYIVMMIAGFVLNYFLGVNAILIILICLIIGIIDILVHHFTKKEGAK